MTDWTLEGRILETGDDTFPKPKPLEQQPCECQRHSCGVIMIRCYRHDSWTHSFERMSPNKCCLNKTLCECVFVCVCDRERVIILCEWRLWWTFWVLREKRNTKSVCNSCQEHSDTLQLNDILFLFNVLPGGNKLMSYIIN